MFLILKHLVLTIFVETSVYAIYFRFKNFPRLVLTTAALNCATHPLAIYAHYQGMNFYLLEVIVSIIEFLVLRLFFKEIAQFKLFALVFFANFVLAFIYKWIMESGIF